MKKITLGLLGFLLLAGSLFAVTLDEINSANPPYPRAFITQMDVVKVGAFGHPRRLTFGQLVKG